MSQDSEHSPSPWAEPSPESATQPSPDPSPESHCQGAVIDASITHDGSGRDEAGHRNKLPAVGEIIAEHYKIEAELGQGGMSAVYRARQLLIDRPVALKVLNQSHSTDPKSVQRFQQEAKVISQLDHPNIVRLHEFGIDSDDRPYLVMDLVEGQSLEQYIKTKGKLHVKEALGIAVDVAEALEHAHEKGIIHRDLKPSNIVLEKSPSGRLRAKVVDFGIAKLISTKASQKLTQTGDTFGSPTYMSPEQCLGKATDRRTDIYSLACVIVEMLTGKPLFEADLPIQILAKHLNEKPQRLSSNKALQDERGRWTHQEATMMAALDRVLAMALSKDADDRYRNAQSFAQDLLIVLTDPGNLAKNLPLYITHFERKSLFRQTGTIIIGLITCAMLYTATLLVYDHTPNQALEQPPETVAPQWQPPPAPPVPLPKFAVLGPTTYKSASLMFSPDYVLDGVPTMHAYADTLRSYTERLQEQQAKGWTTSQDQLQLARDSLNLGRVMVDSGNAKASINEFSRVIALQDLSEENQKRAGDFSLDSALLQSGYLGLGDARLSMGNFGEALESYFKAKEFYTKGDVFDDKLKQGLLLRRIALCYTALGDTKSEQQAKEYLAQAIPLLQIKDPQNAIDRKIIAAVALGDIFMHQNKYNSALSAFDSALQLAKGLPADYNAANAAQIAILQCKKAFCLGMLGQTKTSNQLFEQALIDLTRNRPDESYLQNLLAPRIALARAILFQKAGQSKDAVEQVRIGLAACQSAERDMLALRLSLLKFGLILGKTRPGNLTAPEYDSWPVEVNSLQHQNVTRTLLPGPAITQYNGDNVFQE